MSDIQSQFSVLKQTADRAVANAIARLIEDGEDHELNRINALDFSKRTGFDEEKVISGFLHASRLGLFDLTWNVLCPGCSGVLDAHDTLKSLRNDDYRCGLCACGYEPSVDEQVEVAFTVSPKVRRIARENPHLYDLMFGLSTRATYRPLSDCDVRLSGRSPAFRGVYAHVAQACARLVGSGRVSQRETEVVAAQLWSFVHGFITLELSETFVECDDPLRQLLLPMGVNLSVGLGDTRERATASHEKAARHYESITHGESRAAQ
jgi:hypothetical protein